MADIRITPASSIMSFTSSLNFLEKITQDASGSLNLYGSGSTGRTEILSVDGNNGRLFTVSDDLSDSLFSVNTIAGLPVIEAFADNTVKMGQYGKNVLVVTGSSVGFGTATPSAFRLDAKGSGSIGALKIQKGTGGYLMQGLDSDGYTMIDVYGDIANTNMNIKLGDVGGSYSQPVLTISSTNIQFSSTNVGINATPSSNKLAVGGTVGLQASALGSAATQILVTSADPSSTTRTVQTRTPAEIRSDIGAGTGNGSVTSIATNNGVTGGTINSTGTIGLATAYGDTVNPYASKTANNFLAAPNGSNGVPSFRAIAAADVPTLNQNTTGTATNATNAANIAVTDTTTTNATHYVSFTTGTSGNQVLRVDSSTLTFNPNTNVFTVPTVNSTTAVQGGNGSAGTPAFSFSGDTNTGMYNISGDTLGFSTAGTARMRIDSSGNVGIGEPTIQGRFHVFQTTNLGGTTGNNLILQTLQNTGGAGGNNVYVKDYAVRDATGTDWTTWRHHNSIDIDGSHNTPGTNTKTFWERDPLAGVHYFCLLYTSPSPRDRQKSRMPSSA